MYNISNIEILSAMRARFYLKSQCLVEQTHNKEIVQVRQNARLVVVIDIVQGREKY